MTDHDQIALAVRIGGLPDRVVADRLGCSRRTVRRVRNERNLERNEPADAPIWGTAAEWRLWRFWAQRVPKAQVARIFCRSRQAIAQGLQRLQEQRRVGGIPKRRPDAQTVK
jgi:transposase